MKVKSESEVAQSCPTLSDPMDCSRPGSSVHGIFQARALEWLAIAFSEDEPQSDPKPFFQENYFILGMLIHAHTQTHTHTQIYTHKTQKTKKRYPNFRWYDFNFSSSYFCFLNSPITTLKKSKTDEKETHNYIHTIMILKTSSSESFSSSAYSFQQIFIECLLNKLWDVPVVPVGCYILCDFIWTSLIEGALISYLCSPVHPQIWYKIFFIPHSLTEHQPCVSHYPGQALKGNVIENQHHT